MQMPKVAIFHPHLVEGGGSESTALWTAEALKDDYDVYLITMGEINLERLNECFGTNLSLSRVRLIMIPYPHLFKKYFFAMRGYKLARFCKQNGLEFDVMFSSYNVMDFGKKGIQYIADFSFDDNLRRTFDPSPRGLKKLFYRKSPFRWMYLKLADALAGVSKESWKKNLTITNSNWTRKIIKAVYGINSQTIYHPVVGEFPNIPWDKRENGFVYVGRLVPEKQIEKIIEILGKVKRKGRDIHLHIHGGSNNIKYIRNLRQLCEGNRDWLSIEGGIYGKDKLDFMAKHKFGLHGREYEPFGIAVAELVKAGCIVWTPNSGGPIEIVNHSDLIYEDVEDAVNKISQVLKSHSMQFSLRDHLSQQARKFSTERFMSEIREAVNQFLKTREASIQTN